MFKKNLIAAGMAAALVICSTNAALAFGPSDGGFSGGVESSFQGGGMQEDRGAQPGGRQENRGTQPGRMNEDNDMQNAGERPELPQGMENAGEHPELPEGMQGNEARPVDENGKAVLEDGEELREPAEQLTCERPELLQGMENAGERPELPEGADSEMTEKGPGIDLLKKLFMMLHMGQPAENEAPADASTETAEV